MGGELCMPGLDGKTLCATPEPKTPEPLAVRTPPELVGLPAYVDLQEQIVGSTHAFTIGQLQLEHASTAMLSMEVRARETDAFAKQLGLDAGPLLRARAGAFIPEYNCVWPISWQPTAVTVRFAPREIGVYDADVVITARTIDGGTAQHRIHVHATARSLDQVPEDMIPEETSSHVDAPPASPRVAPARAGGPVANPLDVGRFSNASTDAMEAARDIAIHQQQGVTLAEQQAIAYVEQPPSASWLQALAEAAISIGIAGLSGFIAAGLAPRIAALVAGAAREGSPLVAGISEAVQQGVLVAAPSPEDLTALPGQLVDALRAAGEGAAPSGDGMPNSTNARIDFFERQRDILNEVAIRNRAAVAAIRDQMMEWVPAVPGLAVRAMDGINCVLAKVRDHHAKQLQARASERQWVAFVAGQAVGTDEVREPMTGKLRTVTRIDQVGSSTPGVLQIDVDVTGADSITGAKVRSASINGIAQEIADDLWSTELLHAGVPIRMSVTYHGAREAHGRVMRDEAGRIRVEGFIPHDLPPEIEPGRPMVREEQMHHSAEALCGIVLAKSLKAWGLTGVKTDDATGRGDKK